MYTNFDDTRVVNKQERPKVLEEMFVNLEAEKKDKTAKKPSEDALVFDEWAQKCTEERANIEFKLEESALVAKSLSRTRRVCL